MKRILLIIVMICSGRVFAQDRTGIMLDSLLEGRKIYADHCGSCHNLYLPERFNATEWDKNVAEMQEKGKITNTQKTKILYYLKIKQSCEALNFLHFCASGQIMNWINSDVKQIACFIVSLTI
jgi:hypothetical protein